MVPRGPGEVGTLRRHQVLEHLSPLPGDAERNLESGEAGRHAEGKNDFLQGAKSNVIFFAVVQCGFIPHGEDPRLLSPRHVSPCAGRSQSWVFMRL